MTAGYFSSIPCPKSLQNRYLQARDRSVTVEDTSSNDALEVRELAQRLYYAKGEDLRHVLTDIGLTVTGDWS